MADGIGSESSSPGGKDTEGSCWTTNCISCCCGRSTAPTVGSTRRFARSGCCRASRRLSNVWPNATAAPPRRSAPHASSTSRRWRGCSNAWRRADWYAARPARTTGANTACSSPTRAAHTWRASPRSCAGRTRVPRGAWKTRRSRTSRTDCGASSPTSNGTGAPSPRTRNPNP